MLWERLEKSQDGKELTIVRPNEDVLKALQNIGDEDPAIVLDWLSTLPRPTSMPWVPESSRQSRPGWRDHTQFLRKLYRRVSLRISRCLEVAVREHARPMYFCCFKTI